MTTMSEPSPGGSPVRRATMRDVARLAGVSAKTVSRVVNNEAGVHPETTHRVLDAIGQLGFRRHFGAQQLRLGSSTATIGLVLEDVSNPFYSMLARVTEEVVRNHGRLLLTGSSEEDATRERELVLELCARRVDGLVIVPAGERHSYLVPEMRTGIRVVFVDRPAGDIPADVVLSDNAAGVRAAVTHLAHRGHRRIAFIGDAPGIYTARERLRGFREALVAVSLLPDGDLVAMGPHDASTVSDTLTRMRRGRWPATAFIMGNNRITLLALRHLKASGGTPPALIGFDDFELADLLTPTVTVVAQDPAKIGRAAAELLFARMSGDASPPRRVVLPTRLIVRESSEVSASDAPLPAAAGGRPDRGMD
jgi:LacI family transcriptional regulator